MDLNQLRKTPTQLKDEAFAKYLAGTKAADALFATGEACPANDDPSSVLCRCNYPTTKLCKIIKRIEGIAETIYGRGFLR